MNTSTFEIRRDPRRARRVMRALDRQIKAQHGRSTPARVLGWKYWRMAYGFTRGQFP